MTRLRLSAIALLATALLTSCAALGDTAGGDGSTGSGGSAPCEVLTSADEMRSIVESTDLLEITNVRFGDDGVLRDIACGVGNSGDRGVAVGLSVPVQPCSVPAGLPVDPEHPDGWYGTATNGGLSYAMCTPDGGTVQASYISRLDVPGPSLAQLRDIVTSTIAQLDDLRQIAMATLEDDPAEEPDAEEPGCLPLPAELAAAGLDIEGCVLDSAPNDNGGVTIQLAVDGPDAFSEASDALTAIGMETVFCGDEPKFCGWSTPDGTYNANVTFWEAGTSPNGYADPVLELETWGF